MRATLRSVGKRSAFILAASAALLLVPVARAAITTWDGGGADDNFSTAANWVSNVAPPNNGTADLVFAGSTRLTPSLNADYSVASLTFNNTAGAFTFSNTVGSALTIGAGGITNNDADTQTVNLDTISLGATQTWNASAGALTVGAAAAGVINMNGFTLNLNGNGDKTIRNAFSGFGNVNINAGTARLNAASANFAGTITLNAGATMVLGERDVSGGSAFVNFTLNGGTIVSNSTAVDGSAYLANATTIAGNVTVGGVNPFSFSRITVSGNRTLTLANTALTYLSSLTVPAGATLSRDGAGTAALGALFTNAIYYDISGTLNLNQGITSMYGIAIHNGGVLNVNDILDPANVTTANLTGLNIAAGGLVNVNGGNADLSNVVNSDMTVINGGRLVQLGGTVSTGTLGHVEIKNGGVLQHDGGTLAFGGGTILSVQAGGTFDHNAGTVSFGLGSAISVEGGGQADFFSSLSTPFQITATITGTGSLLHLGGALDIRTSSVFSVLSGGTLSADGRLLVSNTSVGTLNVTGTGSTLTIAGAGATSVVGSGATGTFTLGDKAAATIGNQLNIGDSPANSHGTVGVTGGAVLTLNGGVLVGAFTTAGTTGDVSVDGAGSAVQINGASSVLTVGAASGSTGSITVSNGAAFTASPAAGGGTVLNSTGTMTINGGSANLGVFTKNGGVLAFSSGSLSYGGNLLVGGGGLFGNTLTLASNRTLALTGTTTVEAEQTFTVSGGSFTTGSLTSNGHFNMTSGSATLTSGALNVVATDIIPATVSVSGTANLHIAGAGVIAGNLGTFTISGGTLDAATAPLTANSGGAFVYSGNALINGGFLGGVGTHTVGPGGARFTGGTLASGATLAQNSAATITDFTIAGLLSGNTALTLNGSTSIPGVLNLNVNSGFATANGPVAITGSGGVNIFSGAAMSATAPVTASSGGGIAILAGGGFYPTGGLTLDGGVLVRVATGFFDPGAFTITGGGHATFDGGFDYGTAHTTNVTGIGSQFDVTNGDLFVDAGSTMNVLAGAHATASGRLVISNAQSGAVLVDGVGSQLNAQGTGAPVSVIGSDTVGTLTVRNSASVTIGNEIYIGNSPTGSNGTVNVQLGGRYTSNADVRLANFTTAGIVGVIDLSGSGSTFTISGATSKLLAGAASGSTATINVGTGATFNASTGAGGGVTLNATATLNVNGGTANLGPLTLAGGHINLNSGTLSYTGGLTVGAAGELGANVTLSAGRNLSITGATSVPAAQSLSVNGGTFSTSGVTIAGTASVSGGGVLTTNFVNVNTPGVFTLASGGTLNMPFGNVTLAGAGASAVFSGSTFNASVNSLNAQSGTTITYEGGAAIYGGFMKGQGLHTIGAAAGGLAGNATFTGTTLSNGATLQQSNAATVTNFTGSGTIHNGAALVWDGGALTSSGVLNANSTAALFGFESSGVINVASTGSIFSGIGNLTLGGGSRTTVASGGTLTPAAGTNIQLNGGLLTNNGTINGPLNVNYGSLAKGAGTFGTVNVTDGGRFSPGNSPGTATLASMTFAPGSRYDFELNSALAIAGTGSDLLSISGVLDIAAGITPNSQFTIGVTTLNLTGQSAPLSDFDPAQAYQFLLANSSGGITGFTTQEIALDLSGFRNSYDGTFAVSNTGNRLYLNYAPTPEPSSAVLLLLGGLAAAAHRRRGKADQAAMRQR